MAKKSPGASLRKQSKQGRIRRYRHDDPAPAFAPVRAGRLLRIKCPAATERRLIEIARNAGCAQAAPGSSLTLFDIFDGIHAAAQVAEQAVIWLVHRKIDSTPVTEFRAMVRSGRKRSSLRKTLEKLAALLPDDDSRGPWAQMRKEFTGADPFSNASDGDEAREDEWDDRLHPRHVNVALGQYLHLMDQLERKFAGTRPPQVPERMFVQTLAHYWTENLKLPIEISRRNRQVQGHFVEFVRAVLTLYPREQLKKVYPIERVVLGTLDGHILVVASAHELRPKTHR